MFSYLVDTIKLFRLREINHLRSMKKTDETVTGFRAMLKGEVILPDDSSYDEARTIWNGMFDKKPAIIARCMNAGDVSHSVKFARSNEPMHFLKCLRVTS